MSYGRIYLLKPNSGQKVHQILWFRIPTTDLAVFRICTESIWRIVGIAKYGLAMLMVGALVLPLVNGPCSFIVSAFIGWSGQRD